MKFSNIRDVLFVLIKDPSKLPVTLSERAINLNVRRSVLLNAMRSAPSKHKTQGLVYDKPPAHSLKLRL
jgi:hypothetical protein